MSMSIPPPASFLFANQRASLMMSTPGRPRQRDRTPAHAGTEENYFAIGLVGGGNDLLVFVNVERAGFFACDVFACFQRRNRDRRVIRDRGGNGDEFDVAALQ